MENKMKKALVIANMLFASANVLGMFQFGGNTSGVGDQPGASGFTFRAPVNSQVQVTCVDDSSTQTEILRMEERSMQTENPENLNNDLQNAFLSYINSKGQATDIMLWAAKSNQPNVVDFLIKNSVDVNGSINGQNSLYQAVFNKNLELADHLILNGAKFNANDKENLLFNAIETNSLETVKYLIGKEVNIGYKNGRESFLDRAVLKKYFDIAKYLIENGAEVRNLQKYQVLSFVIENGSLDLVKHFVSDKGVDVNLADGNKRTLLHNAVLFNKYDIAEYLVNNENIDINAQDNNLYTPLLRAVEKNQTDIAELLIKKLAEKDDTGNVLNIMGRSTNQNISIDKTPLYEASQNGSLDIVKLLAENKADLNKKASNGISPIDIAFQNDHLDIMKYLIEQGADINLTDNNGMSLISKIIVKNSKDSVDLVDYLIEKGAKINRQSNDGWTPLHEAVQAGNKKMVQLLLDHDAFVNAADTKGWTPLHEASQRVNIEIFKLLVENGANINASVVSTGYNSRGHSTVVYTTPASIASIKGFANIVKSSRFTSNRLAVHNK